MQELRVDTRMRQASSPRDDAVRILHWTATSRLYTEMAMLSSRDGVLGILVEQKRRVPSAELDTANLARPDRPKERWTAP